MCGTLSLSLWLLPSQDPSWNHRVYRLALTKLSPPLIPFMPLLLKGKGTSACHPAPIPPVPAPECPPDPLGDSSVPMPWGHKGELGVHQIEAELTHADIRWLMT